ncbi:Hpt domain-containing protein [Nocardioides panaciterrulae]|uniref:Hpt domain-containing protein n=1 Tax=Nocardioides panaciterrulae TaxID=661492 RepID=A0A7Y9E6R2_9ACTN|nr:Hpt domain-containing protein [Nocardioides panaciterrulae]NYD42244.1 hypothetical protein [Nocardioides panaciterrulae]
MTAVVTFDEAALRRISDEVDDRHFVWLFARRYRQLLIGRVSRITAALQRQDEDAALDAVLSLKVTSATVGAGELAALAAGLEDDVRRSDLAAARLRAGRLWPAAQRADRALETYLAG